ncbi:hypothetical protein EII34_15720 [Arachnia propionica]|uniref:Uncharacterized protein n=1 Tax=Arachnia propionica TaxID=1750 RepID=A0A3P1SZI3_9ACTN|nr:DUF6301 family protein [Arachnia propionica]RRD02611.1 hypothetical protein EII34_15720 [Arachnia propionica]
MNHLPFHTAHHWITQLAQLPHPITINEIARVATELSWTPTDRSAAFTYGKPESFLIQVSYNRESEEIFAVTFPLFATKIDNIKERVLAADFYKKYIEQASKAWGAPTDHATSSTATIWRLHDKAYAMIYLRPKKIIASFERHDPNDL